MSNSRILSKLTSNLSSNVGKILTVNDSAEITPETNYAWIKSNSAFIAANSAFDSSNTKFSSSGGSISGPVTIDSSLLVTGDFTVSGNTTTLNVETLTIEDKNIVLANTASPTDILADGAGLTIKGDSDKTFNWVDSTDSWTSSENLNLLSGKTFKIAGTDVLSGNTLGSGITSSSLTSVGTLGSLNVTGNVGIGTSPPSRKLHVYGGVDGDIIGQFQNGSGSTSHICFSNTGSNADQVRIGSSGGDLLLSTNYTERLRIDSSGNVGIGTSAFSNLGAINTPSVGLYSSSGARLGLWGNGGRWWYLEGESSNRFGIGFRGAGNTTDYNVITLNTSGNVGIGTSLPGAKLHVAGETLIQPTTATNAKLSMRHGSLANNNYIETDISSNTIFGTNGNELMRIDASGNVGIGETSPSSYGKLAIHDSAIPTGTYLSIKGGYPRYSGSHGYGIKVYDKDNTTPYFSLGSDSTLTINSFSSSGVYSTVFKLDASGKVGINVTPSGATAAKLQVTGGTTNATTLATAYSAASTVIVPKSTSGYSLAIGSGTGDHPYLQISANGAASGDLLLQPYGGNVGIGTSSPASLLDVSSSSTDSVLSLTSYGIQRWQLKTERSTGNFLVYNQSWSTTPITLRPSGNLGLGVVPTHRITVPTKYGYGATDNGAIKIVDYLGSAASFIDRIGSTTIYDNSYYYGGGLRYSLGTASSGIGLKDGEITFFLSGAVTAGSTFTPTQAMTLDTSGNLGIGYTSLTGLGSNGLAVAGNVGIGTSSPGEKLNVVGGGQSTSTLNVTGGNGDDNGTIASDYSLVFQVDANNTVGGRAYIWRYGGKGYSDGTMLMHLDASGYLRLASGTGGIQFNGDTAAANALDDYEEGAWTPVFTGSTSGTTYGVGIYTKIGNQVTVRLIHDSALSASTLVGGVSVTGLPFAVNNYGYGCQPNGLLHIRGAATGTANAPFAILNGTTVYLHASSNFGNTPAYGAQPPTYPASNITQNGITTVIIDWVFTYFV